MPANAAVEGRRLCHEPPIYTIKEINAPGVRTPRPDTWYIAIGRQPGESREA